MRPTTKRRKSRSKPKDPGSRSARNIEWVEKFCRVPDGKLVGKPVKLTTKQREWMARIYDSPTRVFILSLARKNGKTAFIAFLVLLHLVGPEAKPNSQLYSTALSRDQAAIVFSLGAKVVRMSPDLNHYVTIRDTAKQLLCQELGTIYHALSADASTAMGLSPAFTVHDELGQVKGPRSALYEALETASAAQEEPLSIIISTQAPTDADLLSLLIDDGLTGADPRTKVEIYTAPMDADPFSEEAIRAANPHFDELMNQEEVYRQAEDARRLPTREASYRNLILNQRVEARSPFMSRSVFQENGGAPDPLRPGDGVCCGLDLSSVADLTALLLTHEVGELLDIHATFWLPEAGLAEKSRNDRVPYDLWSQTGHIETIPPAAPIAPVKGTFLQTTPGASIEYEFVAAHLRVVFDTYRVRAVAFDRYNMRFLKPWLEKAGFTPEELEKFVEFGQGYQSMSPAIRDVESLFLSRKIRHGNHPVLAMCMRNATIDQDAAENRKFVKGKATGRIDGAVALAMAIGVKSMIAPAEPPKKFQFFAVG